nr:MAG TPA: Large Terminase [Bacteriophage sp.]
MQQSQINGVKNYVEIANQYIEDVLSGKVPACRWVRRAVKRQKKDLLRKGWTYQFSARHACKACYFVEHLKHVKGELAGQCIELQPWQVFIITTVFGWVDARGRRRFRHVYIEVPRGNGKALAIDTPIPTPCGFVTMGDLKVGDLVYGSNGIPCKVTAVTDVMVGRPCFEVEFNTGDVIVADADHQWVTDARSDRDRLKGKKGKSYGPKPSIKTTRQIAETLFCRKDRNHRVCVTSPVSGVKKDFELEPYLLGIWLGDGGTHTSRITTADQEIVDNIRSFGYQVRASQSQSTRYSWTVTDGSKGKYANSDSFRKKLERCGVLHRKHIPADYMNGSIAQRLELLQGLMDTDGYISRTQGQCEFVQKNKNLAIQVYQLIASLGLRPRIMEKRAFIGDKDCGIVYRILFHAYRDMPVFRLTRKVNRLRERPKQRGLQGYRQIVRCEEVVSVPVRCIEVDSDDHCYLAGNAHIVTHNSALSSAIALYALAADNEAGAECYSFATTRDQAKAVFQTAQLMAKASPDVCKALGITVNAKTVTVLRNGSVLEAKSADGSTLDGLITHFACIDELHAHKTRAVYDVVETSIGKRAQPLLWVITTAGFDTTGICYEVRSLVTKVLEGTVEDESRFGIIFSIDEEDDWKTERACIKANPNWGVSVMPENVLDLLKKAINLPSSANNFKTKHLDIWCSASTAWMDMPAWQQCQQPVSVEDFSGERCFIGLDLGAKNDITAKVKVFPQNDEDGNLKLYVFSDFYLPRSAIERSSNASYQGWDTLGLLHVTEGAVSDFAQIEADIRDDLSRFDVQAVAYDPWQMTQMAMALANDGAPMVEFRNTVQNMSDPMKMLEALVQNGSIVHPDDPVMTWMMGNVVARLDAKDNIFPRKEHYDKKIDGPVALIMALGVCLSGVEHATGKFDEFVDDIIVI